MKYNVFDKDNKYLGTIHAPDPITAVEKFKDDFKAPTADHAEERDDDPMRL